MNEKLNRQIIEVIEASDTPVDIETIRATVKHSREVLMSAIEVMIEIGTLGSEFNAGTNQYEYFMLVRRKTNKLPQTITPVKKNITTKAGLEALEHERQKSIMKNPIIPKRESKNLPTWLKELFDLNRDTYFHVYEIAEMMIEKPTIEGTLRDALYTLKGKQHLQTTSLFSEKENKFLTAYGWSKSFIVPQSTTEKAKVKQIKSAPVKAKTPIVEKIDMKPTHNLSSDHVTAPTTAVMTSIPTALITKNKSNNLTDKPTEPKPEEQAVVSIQAGRERVGPVASLSSSKITPTPALNELPNETKFYSGKEGLIILASDGTALKLGKALTNRLIDTLVGSHNLIKPRPIFKGTKPIE